MHKHARTRSQEGVCVLNFHFFFLRKLIMNISNKTYYTFIINSKTTGMGPDHIIWLFASNRCELWIVAEFYWTHSKRCDWIIIVIIINKRWSNNKLFSDTNWVVAYCSINVVIVVTVVTGHMLMACMLFIVPYILVQHHYGTQFWNINANFIHRIIGTVSLICFHLIVVDLFNRFYILCVQ